MLCELSKEEGTTGILNTSNGYGFHDYYFGANIMLMMKTRKAGLLKLILSAFLAFLPLSCNPIGNLTSPGNLAQPNPTEFEPVTEPKEENDHTTAEDNAMTPNPSDFQATGLQPLIDTAVADLADRLAVPASQIHLVEAREVEWPDASLGCPQPGMMYKQVPEDGALIILQVEGVFYRYHSGGNRQVFLCEQVFKDLEKPPPIDLNNLTPPTPSDGIPPGENN